MNINEKIFNEYLKANKSSKEKESELLRNYPDYKDELKDFSEYISVFNELAQTIQIDSDKKAEIKRTVTLAPQKRSILQGIKFGTFSDIMNSVLKPVPAFALATVMIFMILIISGKKDYAVDLAVADFQKGISDIESDLDAIESELYFLDETEAVFTEIDLINENL